MTKKQLTATETANRNRLQREKPLVYEKVRRINELLDAGKSAAIIQLQYNYACNVHCEHCSIKPFQGRKNARSLTPEDVKDLFRQADAMGLSRVTITGGEPLVFPDLDELVAAIDPRKFYINCDTNGMLLTSPVARHLKSIGVDRVQLSVDSLDPAVHDAFRGKEGLHAKAMRGIRAAWEHGLSIFIQTVVTKQRLYSVEFTDFLRYFNDMGIGVFVSYAKPVGAWAGNFDVLIDRNDMRYMETLEKEFKVFTHLTKAYGTDMGCISVKGMFSVTQYGDVLPCPYIHTSIGNIFEEPLQTIIDRGLNIKFFGGYIDTCLIAEDRPFIEKYVAGRIYGKPLPVPWQEVFTDEDFIDPSKK